MKSLLLIRHAKSSRSVPGMNDIDRPLNNRGRNDAPKMVTRLLERKIGIDLLISSPAERAAKTALYFAKAFKKQANEILFVPSLYQASSEIFFNVITTTEDRHKSIAIFSHNPGITEFANQLTPVQIDNMPTCSVFAVKLHSNKWADIKNASKEFLFFDFPKAEVK